MKRLLLSVALALICTAPQPCFADTAWIACGGSTHLMTENSTVSMKSEVVRINVGKHVSKVDAQYVFVNNGPACKLRVGYPDETNVPCFVKELRGAFLSYRSYVNGKRVKTELVQGTGSEFEEFGVWHAKYVDFPANTTLTMRDVYTVPAGLVPIKYEDKVYAKTTYYVLRTASSWHGNIEQAHVYITFNRLAVPKRLDPQPAEKYEAIQNSGDIDPWKHNPGTVVYAAPVKPIREGRTLHFLMNDIHPTEKDDIMVMYDKTQGGPALIGTTLNTYARYFGQSLRRSPWRKKIKVMPEET